jgi:hypothetical protein
VISVSISICWAYIVREAALGKNEEGGRVEFEERREIR